METSIISVSQEKWDSIPSDYKGVWQAYMDDHPEWKGRKVVLSTCITNDPLEKCRLWVEHEHFLIEKGV